MCCVALRHVNGIVVFTSYYDKLKLQEEVNDVRGSPGGPSGKKNPPTNAGDIRDAGPWVRKDPLEEEMATHFSIFAWRIPRTEEPGGLQSTGSQRVWHDWSDLERT